MSATPFLKPFNTEGGTLYVFPSVSKDLTRTFVSNDYEFKFSHFACLNLPDLFVGRYDADSSDIISKGLYLSTLKREGEYTGDKLSIALVENLQNYVMNFETGILNGEGDNDTYDSDILTTVSEKVFFNWLQKVGGIVFSESGNEEVDSIDSRTVQYIGNIDVMNTVEIDGDVFEELYIHIPSTVGASTNVYFRTGNVTDNKNYLNKKYSFGGDSERTLEGHNQDETNPYDENISVIPMVDGDEGGNFYTGDIGHTIDFRDSSYSSGISNMNSESLVDFEFNAVLIYYDILQKTSQKNVKKTATNLYGILFLDNPQIITDSTAYLQRYSKKRETVYGNGNSYALKIDLKVTTYGDTVYTSHPYSADSDSDSINGATAMIKYVKALEQLQKCIDFFYTQKKEIVNLSERVATLENLVMGIDTITSLKNDITRLYDLYDGNMTVDTATLLGLIDANAKKLDTIMNGGKDLKLQYDTDVLQPGPGIGMTKTPNKVVISSEQRYSINTVLDGNYTSEEVEITPNHMISTIKQSKICNIKLRPGENFAVIYLRDEGNSSTNLNINIDDSDYNWVVGQSLKIRLICEGGDLVFENDDVTGIIIKPTSNTTLSIPGYESEGNDYIEVVCIGEDNFIYVIK